MKNSHKEIVSTLREKGILISNIFSNTTLAFEGIKNCLEAASFQLNEECDKFEKTVKVSYRDQGDFQAELDVAEDTLIFVMQTNVFRFNREHIVWKDPYLAEDVDSGFCGIISVYNFLSDSFRYNRMNDIGNLIARIFINKGNRYLIEGKKEMGFVSANFEESVMDEVAIKKIVDAMVLYCLKFDLLVPPYDQVGELSVSDVLETSGHVSITTGKRLGFKFHIDENQ